MSLMIIKRGILETFRGVIFEEVTNAKQFLVEIEKRFAKSNKAEISILLHNLISMRYNGKGNIREYITKDVLVHLVLNFLSAHFNQFKVSYNCQKEKQYLNKLFSFCVQEEERLKQDKTESAHLESTSKDKGKNRKRNIDKDEAGLA